MSTQHSDDERTRNSVQRESYWVPSIAVIGCVAVGIVSLIGGFMAMSEASNRNPIPYIGAGACWLASGLAFGQLANAIYRR